MKNWLAGITTGTTSKGTANWLKDTVGYTASDATLEYLRQNFDINDYIVPIQKMERSRQHFDLHGPVDQTGIRAHIMEVLENNGLHTGSGNDETFICFYDWLNTGYSSGDLTTGAGEEEAFNWTGQCA